jgi:hypothetical protein
MLFYRAALPLSRQTQAVAILWAWWREHRRSGGSALDFVWQSELPL